MKNKKTKEIYSREFKLAHLGEGEWLDEPDQMEFEYNGIKCLIARVCIREPYAKEETWFGGHLCGYIFLPKEHKLWGKSTDDVELECHGGITYAETTEEGHLVGFDCAHSIDLIPSMVHMRKIYPIPDIFPIPENMKDHLLFNPVYRNMDFCIKQVKSLAKQAAIKK